MRCFSDVLALRKYNIDDGVFQCSTHHLLHVQILKEIQGHGQSRSHLLDHNIYMKKIIFWNRAVNWDPEKHAFINS